MSKDYGYFGSGSSGYHQYMTSFNHNFGDGGSSKTSAGNGKPLSSSPKKDGDDKSPQTQEREPTILDWIIRIILIGFIFYVMSLIMEHL